MVSAGQEPQTPEQAPRTTRPLQPHRQQWHALNILLLIILLGLFSLSFSYETNYESNVQRFNFVVGDHPVLEMRPNSQEKPFVAIVAHGFTGSKDLMSTFGTELARVGVTTYMLDFSGHGEASGPAQLASSAGLLQDNVTALSEVINAVRTTKIATPTPTALPTTGTASPGIQSTPTRNQGTTTTTTTPAQSQSTSSAQNTPQPQQATPQNQNAPQQTPTPSPRIILIGHSMGSEAVSSYMMKHQKDSDDIIANILISPTAEDTPTALFPRNLLLLAGQNDFPAVQNNAVRLFNSACPAQTHLTTFQTRECGKVDDNTGRRIAVVPTVDHMLILNANATFQEITSWLHSVEPTITTTTIRADSRLLGMLFGALSILLAVFPLCSLLIDIFGIRVTVQPTRGIDLLLFFLCLLPGIAVALAVQSLWRPLSFIHLAISNYIVGYFFLISLVMAPLLFLFRRRLPLPPRSQVLQQVLAGAIPAVLLYLTLGQLITFTWQRITFNLPRLLDFVLIALFLFPLFLIEEGVIRGYHSRHVLWTVFADLAFKILLIGGLFIAPWTSNAPYLDFMTVILFILALVLLFFSAVSSQFYHSGRAALAGAIFSTLIMAWCLATTFPIV
jgi:alpha-beta hydrolase superfamily lysophospholipase